MALLIGNGDYNEMETLKAVESDIRNLHATLADKLGFKVISLMDLKYHEMMKALEQFYKYLSLEFMLCSTSLGTVSATTISPTLCPFTPKKIL